MSQRDIAVVGMACVFPGAADLASYWRNIVDGVDAIGELPADRWPGSRNVDLPPEHPAAIGCRRGGFIPTPYLFDALRFKVMPSVARRGDPDQFILLQILADALEDAGIGADDPRRATTDVIVGRGGYTSNKMMDLFLRADLIDRLQLFLERRLPGVGARELERLVQEMRDSLGQPDPDNLATSIPNLAASRAANRLDLCGAAYNVDAACASSLVALDHGMRRLREGLCDVALVCGVNFTHIPAFWYLFTRVLAISPSGTIRPFDRRADGLLIGEGAGAVVLERLEDARRWRREVYALVKGAGTASDGQETGILAPAPAGQVRALAAAYADAAVEPDTIDLLEAHGTGTVPGDLAEIESVRTFFGRRSHPHATRVMGSVKSMIGHTMPASGIASFIKVALALSNKLLPPSLHCDEPRPELEELPFYVNGRTRPWLRAPGGPRRAGISAFGFGGINAHVVLEEVTARRAAGAAAGIPAPDPPLSVRPVRPELRRPSELLVFGAATPGELARALRRAARFAREDRVGFRLEELALALAREVAGDAPCRLAFIASERDDLVERLESLASRLEHGLQPDGPRAPDVFYRCGPSSGYGRIAGLFPGLAFPGLLGNYPAHLIAACAHSPRAREVFDLVEARDCHPEDPLPTSYLLQPPDHLPQKERERLGLRFAAWMGTWTGDRPTEETLEPIRALRSDERLLSVMGMLASNEAGWRRLRAFGIPFDMLSGQSLGEISALCAAGCFEFEAAMARLWPYLGIDPRLTDLGCLAFVAATEERLAPLLAGFDEVSIGLHLAPEALVVGGPEASIGELMRLLRAQNVTCQKLPFPPIHTPRLAGKQREYEMLDSDPLPLAEPRLTVYSSLACAPMSGGPQQLRRYIASNLTHPIRCWQTLRRMYDDGARIFIQVGAGALAGNVRTVLPEDDVLSLALDVDYRDPITQLQHLCGKLFVAGVPIELEELFEARAPRELALDAPRPEPAVARGAVPLLLYWPPLHVEQERVAAPVAAADRAAPAAAVSAAASPFVGRVVEHVAGRKLVQLRRFDVGEDLYLADHAFVGRQHGKPMLESFPVVPLTVTLEMLAESAALLAPGRALIGFEEVRAKKWIVLDGVERLDVQVQAEVQADDDGVVTVSAAASVGGEIAASARVKLATRYRLDLDLRFSELTGARPFPMPVERLYTDHHFFHGPRFHCLSAIPARGDQGLAGEAVVPAYDDFLRSTRDPRLALDPVVLDGAGQLLGAMFFDRGVHILPVAVDRIEFYRSAPPAGTRVPIRLELVDFNLDERRVSAIMEVQDGAGGVWFRISGWQDVVFRYSRKLLQAQRDPTRYTLADETALPGLPANAVATVVARAALRDARPDSVARIYLHESEWPLFRAADTTSGRQREWLMGRIAAKDAARVWLARAAGGPLLHPTRLAVENDPAGRPVLRLPGDGAAELPLLSIAHKGAVAAAVAADRPVGIDVEPREGARALRLEDFATEAEIGRMAQAGASDAEWMTRLWCGKEAAAKALGTGLQGRPKAFEAVELAHDGRMVVVNGEPERRVRVSTSRSNGWTFAVASIADATS